NRTEVVGQRPRPPPVRPGDGGSGVVGGVGLGRRTPSPGGCPSRPLRCSHLGGGGGGSRPGAPRVARLSGAGPGRAASGAEVPPHVPPPGDPPRRRQPRRRRRPGRSRAGRCPPRGLVGGRLRPASRRPPLRFGLTHAGLWSRAGKGPCPGDG